MYPVQAYESTQWIDMRQRDQLREAERERFAAIQPAHSGGILWKPASIRAAVGAIVTILLTFTV
jgi:hypothetical protein